jgi:uncharacterized membrane protein
MKNIIIISLGLFIIGCKGSNEKRIVIYAPIDKVWTVFSDLGAHEQFTALDSASLTPSGKVAVGSIWYVSQGKNYAKSEVTVVEPMKRIETKLIEATWPASEWSETHTFYGDSQSTEVSWKIDFTGEGAANLFFPFFNAYVGSDTKKSLKNLKAMIESE